MALYSKICLVFIFNGGSHSSKAIKAIDTKIGMESLQKNCTLITLTPLILISKIKPLHPWYTTLNKDITETLANHIVLILHHWHE